MSTKVKEVKEIDLTKFFELNKIYHGGTIVHIYEDGNAQIRHPDVIAQVLIVESKVKPKGIILEKVKELGLKISFTIEYNAKQNRLLGYNAFVEEPN